jgi:(R)-amidase
MKVQLVQLKLDDGLTSKNLERILRSVADAPKDVDVVVFPEACITGFLLPEMLKKDAITIDSESIKAVERAAKDRNCAIVVGFIEIDSGRFFNTTVFITPEGIKLKYRKTHLWVSEQDCIVPGDRYVTINWRGVCIGILICYDTEFPESARAVAALGAQLIIVTDGNMEPDGYVHRNSSLCRAQENQVFVVVANRVGEGLPDAGLDEPLIFAGTSLVADPYGKLQFIAGNGECTHVANIDIREICNSKKRYNYSKDQRFQIAGERIEHECGKRELMIPV